MIEIKFMDSWNIKPTAKETTETYHEAINVAIKGKPGYSHVYIDNELVIEDRNYKKHMYQLMENCEELDNE